MTTKIDQVRTAFATGDYATALRITAKFPRLGAEKEAITRGWAALTNAEFYRDLGRDPEALVTEALAVIRVKYGID